MEMSEMSTPELAHDLHHLPPPAVRLVHLVELAVATEVARLEPHLLRRARLVERTGPRRAAKDGQSGTGHTNDQQEGKGQPRHLPGRRVIAAQPQVRLEHP
eukprot:scaffold101247_cov66-Phaeocystis_antarctica.AAC.5